MQAARPIGLGRADQIRALDKRRLIRKLDALDAFTGRAVKTTLKEMLVD